MNITDYTSGPWKAKDQWGYIKIHSKDEGVCAVHGLGVNSQANARLISSAPDLLQVVEDYVLLCDLHDYVGAVPDAARAALRKAKGEA
jgi:hypothetical protein